MVKRFLITTALEETWSDNEPVLFLGEWCRLYSRKHRWSKMDAEVLPYHWDDRAKLFADYKYLKEFQERLLVELTFQLNQIHHVNHEVRYWRILLGPWLGHFIPMIFDRWCSIQQAISQCKLSGTIVLTGQEETLIPNDMVDFLKLCVRDEWNHHLYASILRQFTKVIFIERNRSETISKGGVTAVSRKKRIKQMLSTSYARVASIFTREQDAFFLDTYLPTRDEMQMHLRFGQVPQRWNAIPVVQAVVDGRQRQWVVNGKNLSEFETCVRSLIPQQIPTAYLEGYHQLVEQTSALPWPKQPKIIWTSNAFHPHDVFKAWAAEKVENGSPLVIGQHGGLYGMGRWSSTEEHEMAISDCYITWGWSEPGQPKIKPVGQLKSKRPLGVRHAMQPNALLVTTTVPRQSYEMYSLIISSQWLDYFNDQCAFVENLALPIRDALTVRLFTHDCGWDQMSRWRDRFPDLQLNEGHSNIMDLIRQSRIYISTYNGTTFLESFTMNVPTVIYWNPNHWELRDSAIPYFEDLKRVGIFHETPESAARHVNAIWHNIDEWWNSTAVGQVVEHFKQRYCSLPPNLIDRVEKTLKEVMTVSDCVKNQAGFSSMALVDMKEGKEIK